MESTATPKSPGTNQPILFSTNKDSVKTEYDKLSQEEQAVVDNYRSKLNILDTNSISDFGSDATGKISSSSKALIEGAKTKDLGEASTLLLDMRDEINSFDKKVSSNPILGFLQSNTAKLKRYKNSYETVSSSLEGIKDRMANALNDIGEKLKHYEQMFNENDMTQREIMLYVIAAEKEVVAGIERLDEMYKLISAEFPENVQMHPEYINYTLLASQIEMLERRIGAMKISRHMVQTAQPQILMMQKASSMVSEKLKQAASTTIPAWHTQVSIAIGIDEIARTSAMLDELDKTTDRLLRQNSENINAGMIKLAKSQDSALNRIDTLKEISKNTKKTLEDTRKIIEENANKRIKAEQEMIKLEAELTELSKPQITNATKEIIEKYRDKTNS